MENFFKYKLTYIEKHTIHILYFGGFGYILPYVLKTLMLRQVTY